MELVECFVLAVLDILLLSYGESRRSTGRNPGRMVFCRRRARAETGRILSFRSKSTVNVCMLSGSSGTALRPINGCTSGGGCIFGDAGGTFITTSLSGLVFGSPSEELRFCICCP